MNEGCLAKGDALYSIHVAPAQEAAAVAAIDVCVCLCSGGTELCLASALCKLGIHFSFA